MTRTNGNADEVVRRGQAIYDEHIRAQVEPEHRGKYLIINVNTGEYEMVRDDVLASRRAKARFPEAPLFAVRVGYRAVHRLGGRMSAPR